MIDENDGGNDAFNTIEINQEQSKIITQDEIIKNQGEENMNQNSQSKQFQQQKQQSTNNDQNQTQCVSENSESINKKEQKYLFQISLAQNQLEHILYSLPRFYTIQPVQQKKNELNRKQNPLYDDQFENYQQKTSNTPDKLHIFDENTKEKRDGLRKPPQRIETSCLDNASISMQDSIQQQATPNSTKNKSKELGQILKVCFKILQLLKSNTSSGPFLFPVDPIQLGCPDYFSVIKRPMDLSTVEKRLRAGLYDNQFQFAQDVRLIWQNSYNYNEKGSEIQKMTKQMDQTFSKLFREYFKDSIKDDSLSAPVFQKGIDNAGSKLGGQVSKEPKHKGAMKQSSKSGKKDAQQGQGPSLKELQKTVDRMSSQIKTMHGKGGQKKPKKDKDEKEKQVTAQQKLELGIKIRKLSEDHLAGIYQIVKDSLKDSSKNEVVIDLDILENATIRELERYVDSKSKPKGGRKSKQKLNDQMNALTEETTIFHDDSSQPIAKPKKPRKKKEQQPQQLSLTQQQQSLQLQQGHAYNLLPPSQQQQQFAVAQQNQQQQQQQYGTYLAQNMPFSQIQGGGGQVLHQQFNANIQQQPQQIMQNQLQQQVSLNSYIPSVNNNIAEDVASKSSFSSFVSDSE